MKFSMYLSALALTLAACSEDKLPEADASNSSEIMFVPEAAKKPAHRYDFKEGLTYGYISDISEEDKKIGKAVGEVMMFTYHGGEGGIHKLRSVDPKGQEIARYECSTPCVAIKASMGSTIDRIAYSTDSVIGSVFQDAMNGHLEPVPKPSPPSIVASGWAGEYEGVFENNATGSVTVKDGRYGVSVSIGVGHERCTGGIEFTAPRPISAELVKRFPADDSGNRCMLTLSRDGRRLTVAEDACSYYHGAECSFNGEVRR